MAGLGRCEGMPAGLGYPHPPVSSGGKISGSNPSTKRSLYRPRSGMKFNARLWALEPNIRKQIPIHPQMNLGADDFVLRMVISDQNTGTVIFKPRLSGAWLPLASGFNRGCYTQN